MPNKPKPHVYQCKTLRDNDYKDCHTCGKPQTDSVHISWEDVKLKGGKVKGNGA